MLADERFRGYASSRSEDIPNEVKIPTLRLRSGQAPLAKDAKRAGHAMWSGNGAAHRLIARRSLRRKIREAGRGGPPRTYRTQ